MFCYHRRHRGEITRKAEMAANSVSNVARWSGRACSRPAGIIPLCKVLVAGLLRKDALIETSALEVLPNG